MPSPMSGWGGGRHPRRRNERDSALPDLPFSYLGPLLHILLSTTEVQRGK